MAFLIETPERPADGGSMTLALSKEDADELRMQVPPHPANGCRLLTATSGPSTATPVDPELLERIGPTILSPAGDQDELAEHGRKLFFEETFDGNGRTCGTCHPATNNFTIDPAYIATLPPDDPLFVAEFDPALAGLEVPALMREFGLILENLDGFDRPGVMRGVPHNLAPADLDAGRAGRTYGAG